MSKKKVVLLRAFAEAFDEKKLGESLALGYLKSYIDMHAPEWDTKIINPCLQEMSVDQAVEQACTHKPDVLGISITFQHQLESAQEIGLRVKQRFPKVHICVGGMFPTSAYEELLLETECFDSICIGEGEETFKELLDHLSQEKDWRNIKGIAFRNASGNVQLQKTRKRIADLSTLPFPDRSHLPLALSAGGVIQVEASRGCNALCSFCDVRSTGWVKRSVESLVDELEQVTTCFPGHQVWLIDNIFIGFDQPNRTDRFTRAKLIAEEIISRKLHVRFAFQDRAENMDYDTLQALKRAGLNRLYIGVESFSNSALTRWQKGESPQQNIKALEVIGKVGIYTQIGFLVFDDQTTIEEIEENIIALEQVSGHNPFLHLHNFNELIPYLGTYLYKQYRVYYGKAPDLNAHTVWDYDDDQVLAFRDEVYRYLGDGRTVGVWPATEVIFLYFDNPIFQQDLHTILPTKNHCFVRFLRLLYEATVRGDSEEEKQALCNREIEYTKTELLGALTGWKNTSTRRTIREAVEKISSKDVPLKS